MTTDIDDPDRLTKQEVHAFTYGGMTIGERVRDDERKILNRLVIGPKPVNPFFWEPPMEEFEPAETRLESWEREIAKRGVFAKVGWESQKFFYKWLHSGPRGRPRKQSIDEAAKLVAAGRPFSQIYAVLGISKRDEQSALREALRQRRLRGRRRQQQPAATRP